MREVLVAKFAAEFVANGGNATQAALKVADYSTYGSARMNGSRLLRLAHKAGLVEKNLEKMNEATILSAQEALEILSEQAAGLRPTKVTKKHVKQLKQDGEGWEMVPGRETQYDTKGAAAELLAWHKPQDKGGDNRSVTINLLGQAPPEQLLTAVKGLLTQGDE